MQMPLQIRRWLITAKASRASKVTGNLATTRRIRHKQALLKVLQKVYSRNARASVIAQQHLLIRSKSNSMIQNTC